MVVPGKLGVSDNIFETNIRIFGTINLFCYKLLCHNFCNFLIILELFLFLSITLKCFYSHLIDLLRFIINLIKKSKKL